MDQAALSSDSVLEMLLKTNRPPTDQETAVIRESMAPTNAKLKIVETQISDTVAHIQELKMQVEQAEIKLQRLREEEAAILETFADHRRVFSPFRNLPEDVLREICVACIEGNMPKLYYEGGTPSSYVLAQICSGLRNIALTTPRIWASMEVQMGGFYCYGHGAYHQAYSILAQKARKWFERAGSLALTIVIEDFTCRYTSSEGESDPSNILFDTLLSYSPRWKELQFNSSCKAVCTPMLRIAALTAVHVPLLQSVSVRVGHRFSTPVFRDGELLTIPSLKHVTLQTYTVQEFTVNWAVLTSIMLRGLSITRRFHSTSAIARILQQTKCLVSCDIAVCFDQSEEHHSDEIRLPFLKTLLLDEIPSETTSFGAPSILDLIIAPILEIFRIRRMCLDLSLSNFLERSPCIWELYLPYFKSLLDMTRFLRRCPSLTVLCLWPGTRWETHNADSFLRAFVEEDDAGVLCPRLQKFHFTGNIDFSLQTLRLFFERKQGKIALPNILPWKRVRVCMIGGHKATETHRQILDLVSEKKAAGLDVEVTVE
ncbi:hypothetical protein HYPSUDRAFT_168622 [Hypholoma sublateritium FD-334 SS-4]|uniref:F-box domain-containing protein n=1 Tax=Hypholoma sublateritium (strain FD-334 SS-4) TaxID=945553 RepID=A0A0D2PFW0_HYPSF|nr:hypothetical protein HYPSUDRAFT_168622 [Hypholoma sublateritium FD-334 SS-4]